jgi:AmiR/NasT family two-component response regulator
MIGRTARKLLKPLRSRAGWAEKSLMEEHLNLIRLEEEIEELHEQISTKKEAESAKTLLGKVKDARRSVKFALTCLTPYRGE